MVLGKDVRETAIVAESAMSDLECLIAACYGTLTHFYTCPMGRKDTLAVSHRNSSASQAVGSRGRSEGYGHLRSPLRQDEKGVGSEATAHHSEFEGDIQCQTEQGMGEQVPAERRSDRAGVVPVGRVVGGPGVGGALVPS